MPSKRLLLVSIILILSTLNLSARGFSKVASVKPLLTQKGDQKQWCPVCGMSLKMFYKTSHSSKTKNNKKRQYCSMRCLVMDMKEYKLDSKSIRVIDAKTQKTIDAHSAFYVVGSKVKGTMSRVSKLAFASQIDAQNFTKKYKGKVVDFHTAIAMAKKSLNSDIAMIKKKKSKKMYPMGKKIFTKMCNKKIDLTNFLEINELKSAIKNKQLCHPLKEKQLQAVSLYLWEVKRFGDLKTKVGTIKVTEDEKCPVCGMFVYKYPKWVAQIFYEDKHLSFDGVKDLMKYYFDNKDKISKVLVTDYYSQKAIDGTKAFYVLGSDIYGPMGNELIPFEDKSDAKTFYMDHRGSKIIQFHNIKAEEIYKLDE